jgi:hypothetical protein
MSVVLKWIFPGFFVGMLLLMGLIQLASESPSPAIVLFPVIALSIVGLFAGSIWGWVDEVTDHGDSLVFRKGKTRQVVKLEDIVNISAESMMVPKKLTVLTREAGPLGSSLSFGVSEMFPFSEPAMLSELVRRVDQARQGK